MARIAALVPEFAVNNLHLDRTHDDIRKRNYNIQPPNPSLGTFLISRYDTQRKLGSDSTHLAMCHLELKRLQFE